MNKHAKRNLAAGAACAVGLGMLLAPQAAVAAPITVDPATTAVVNLLHFNDFHGRLDSTRTVQFAGTIEQLRADYPTSTLLLSGGDNVGASNFTSASQGDEPTIDVLNALDVDASAVGNHEFDRGVDDLTGRIDPLADFSYLSANVTRDGAPIGPAYETFVLDGVTVGVIGAVTAQTPSLVDRGGIQGVVFSDPVVAVNAVAADLVDGDPANGEADVIVAEIHDGSGLGLEPNAPQSEQQAVLAPDAAKGGTFGDIVHGLSAEVDVIFNGHTHRTYTWLAPVPGVEGATRPVVQSNEYSNLVGQVVLTVDRATGEVEVLPGNLWNHSRTTQDPAALAAAYPRVAEVKAIVDAAVAAAQVVGNREVGTIGDSFSLPALSNRNRSEESTMAQFVADMYRDQLASAERGGAEIGIVNPGGVRDNLLYEATAPELEDGIVRLAEANAVLPFINNLWSATLTGAQLDRVLEEQWQRAEDGTPFATGNTYLQLGLSDNVTYVSDPSRPIDDRVSDIAIDGRLISPDEDIRVASSSFLFGPGDNFWTLGDSTDVQDSGLVDLDAMLAHLAENPGIAPDYSVRHVDVTGLPTAPVAEGSEVTVEIARVDRIRSAGAEASSIVEILDAKGEVVGSGDVVVNADGSGAPLTTSATVTFTATVVDRAASAAVAAPVSQTYAIRADNGTLIPFRLLVTPAPIVAEPPLETPAPTEPAAPSPSPVESGPAGGTGGDARTDGRGSLPRTGSELSPALWIGAGGLVLLGGALLLIGRLRRVE